MPHIVPYKERCQLLKNPSPNPFDDWSRDLAYKYVRPALQAEANRVEQAVSSLIYRSFGNPRETLFQIIEKIIDESFPTITSEYFDKFVDIKEVPYGRHNSDTNN